MTGVRHRSVLPLQLGTLTGWAYLCVQPGSRGCSSVDRVLASEAKGRGFDPRQPRQPSLTH
jgi:hypothetical protein